MTVVMPTDKKVSYLDIADQVNVENVVLYRVKSAKDDTEFDILLKPALSMKEVSLFVHEVISSLYDEELDEYYDEQRSYVIDRLFLQYYTNIELPKDHNECYKFICSHYDYIRGMKSNINIYQWNSIMNSIELKEQVILKRKIQKNEDFDLLMIRLNNIAGLISDVISNTNNTFKDVDVATLIKNLSNKKLSEQKVIKILSQTDTAPQDKK